MSSKSDPAFNIDHLGNLAFKVVVHVEKKTGWVGRTGTVGKALRLRLVEQVVRRVVEPALQILWARVLHLRPVALAQRHRKAVLVLRQAVSRRIRDPEQQSCFSQRKGHPCWYGRVDLISVCSGLGSMCLCHALPSPIRLIKPQQTQTHI